MQIRVLESSPIIQHKHRFFFWSRHHTLVTNLAVKRCPHLTFGIHIKHLNKTCFIHLKNISKLCPFMSFADAKKLSHAFVSSRLEYCTSLLIGITPPKPYIIPEHCCPDAYENLQTWTHHRCCSDSPMAPHNLQHSLENGNPHPLLLPWYCPSLPQRLAHPAHLWSRATNLLPHPQTNLRTKGDRAFTKFHGPPHLEPSLSIWGMLSLWTLLKRAQRLFCSFKLVQTSVNTILFSQIFFYCLSWFLTCFVALWDFSSMKSPLQMWCNVLLLCSFKVAC